MKMIRSILKNVFNSKSTLHDSKNVDRHDFLIRDIVDLMIAHSLSSSKKFCIPKITNFDICGDEPRLPVHGELQEQRGFLF